MNGMKKAVLSLIQNSITLRRETAAKLLSEANKDADYFTAKDTALFTYRVTLNSLWSHEGEESTTVEQQGELRYVIAAAVKKFKETNKRSDVQAQWFVNVILPSGTQVPVPEKFWKHLAENGGTPPKK